jgi:4-amino-4-deoxy-L-arabinose transferase-like glycosyltransferase
MKYFAWSLDRGIWPYTDVHTYNLPMTIYLNWFALKIFGNSSWGFRLLDVSWLICLSGLTFLYLKEKVSNLLIAIVGSALCLTLSENATNFGAFQRETIMLPFWVLSLIFFERIRKNYKQNLYGFWLGFCICISVLVKPTGFLLLLFILIMILIEKKRNRDFLN